MLPQTNESVVVTARAIDRQGINAITLRYRVDPDPNYIDVPMSDDGNNGDAIASDGIYSATIPGQADGEMVAFYVQARDSLNAIGTFPQDVFPKPGFDRCWPNDALVRECLVRWGEVQMAGDFATYHLWVSAVNSNRWHTRGPMNNTTIDGTFVYNNSRVFYNALPLFSGSPFHRTNSTAGPAGPLRVDYEMNFPDDDPLLAATDFVLNNPGNADRYTISDQSALNEQVVYKIFEGLGMPNNHRRYIHMFVNGSQRSKAYERTGHFIFEDSQQPNGDMIAEWFPNDAGGQLFKVEDWFEFDDNGFDVAAYNDADLERRTVALNGQQTFVPAPYRFMFRKRSVGVGNSANDYSPIFALIDAASPADNPTNATVDPDVFGAVADYEAWMRHFAVQRAVGNFDSYGWNRGKNDYLYRTINGFAHMPWDVDYALGLGRPPNEPLFETTDSRVAAMFNTPVIVRAYWRAFHDLVNGPFSNAHLDPFIDARVNALLANNIDIDLNAVASIKAYINNRQSFLQNELATVDVPFAIDAPSFFETETNFLILTGTAPVGVKTITLNGAAYPITWTDATHFVMRFALHAGYNTYTLQGYDRFGAVMAGANTTVTAYFTGTEPDATGALLISEIFYAAAPTGAQFVEIVNQSADSFDLSGWRVEGANLTFPLGSIVTNGQTIVLARNRAGFNAAFPGVPVFAVFGANLSVTQTLALVRTNGVLGTVIDAVRFENAAPWVSAATGQSLQLIDMAQDNGRAANWGVSTIIPVTPGTLNSVAAILPAFDPVWLNEIQCANITGFVDNFGESSPWIELYNSGATPVVLDNYFLADNFTSNLTQWAFPPGTTLAAGERKLLWADGQRAQTVGADLHTSFALEYSGRLALVRLTNGEPQIIDHLAWKWLGPNVTYGSSPEGQPVFRFALSSATPAATNVARLVPVSINEYLAINSTGIRDPADNDAEDWIELFNGGTQTIDLSGFYLTDSFLNPIRFRVPTNGQYRIPPNGHFIIWADDEAGQNTAARADLHVNFRLASASGYIGLFAPDGATLIDGLSYGQQFADMSDVRYADGASNRYSLSRPTPRNPNSVSVTNSPPRFPFITNVLITPGQGISQTVRAVDPDGQALTYSTNEASALPGSSLSAQGGVYRWNVPSDQPPGDYPITITATDTGTPALSDVVTFYYIVRPPSALIVTNISGPVLRSVASVNGQATFTIETIPGRTYRVFYKDDLDAPSWTQLGPDFVAANATASLSDNVVSPRRFYRVQQVN